MKWMVVEIITTSDDPEEDKGGIRCYGPFDTFGQADEWTKGDNIRKGHHACIEKLIPPTE